MDFIATDGYGFAMHPTNPREFHTTEQRRESRATLWFVTFLTVFYMSYLPVRYCGFSQCDIHKTQTRPVMVCHHKCVHVKMKSKISKTTTQITPIWRQEYIIPKASLHILVSLLGFAPNANSNSSCIFFFFFFCLMPIKLWEKLIWELNLIDLALYCWNTSEDQRHEQHHADNWGAWAGLNSVIG